MLPIDSPARPDGSAETPEGVPPAAVAVRPPDEDALRGSEDELLSAPDGLRVGFIGWFAT